MPEVYEYELNDAAAMLLLDKMGKPFYTTPEKITAMQMDAPFKLDGIPGETGDAIANNGGKCWVIKKEVFEKAYRTRKSRQKKAAA